jgi:hypothetical protein
MRESLWVPPRAVKRGRAEERIAAPNDGIPPRSDVAFTRRRLGA